MDISIAFMNKVNTMQAFGNIASPIQRKTTKAGKDYSEFRLAESQRSKPGSTSEEPKWYEVRLLN